MVVRPSNSWAGTPRNPPMKLDDLKALHAVAPPAMDPQAISGEVLLEK